jgi:arsenite/tail-anchored protein-transporting ATPase
LDEQFRSACTIEIASFDRFTDFLTNTDFDLIVFDTAPTGHTIRLLELPIDWSKHIEESAKGSGQTCIGPVSSIQGAKEKYDRAIAAMRDPEKTEFYLVTRPESTPVNETIRALNELKGLGVTKFNIIINGVVPENEARSDYFSKVVESQTRYIETIGDLLPYPTTKVHLQRSEIKGLNAFDEFAQMVFEGKATALHAVSYSESTFEGFSSSQELERLIAKKHSQKIIIVTGKGGVGKTVTACAVATHAAKSGSKTLLVTTDPAAHIGYVINEKVGNDITKVHSVPNLYSVLIDQKKAVETYKEGIISNAVKTGYNEDMLLALKEELESPCTEEMAVFEEFSSLINSQEFDHIVFDTAPTGHTLRLLELPYDYAKQVEMMVNVKQENSFANEAKKKLETLVAKLKDKDYCSFLLVLYPEYTPIFEAKRAMEDLCLAGITVQAVIANNVLEHEACDTEFFRQRFFMQQHYLKVTEEQFRLPIFKIKMFNEEIIGLSKLEQVEKQLFN